MPTLKLVRKRPPPSPKALPLNAVSDALNNSEFAHQRGEDKDSFRLHVSDVLQTKGPYQFCARQQVLAYHGNRRRTKGKITPARRFLFATGHFQHDWIVKQFIANAPVLGQYVYAKWTCEDHEIDPEQHDQCVDIYGNVIKRDLRCRCGKQMRVHNEIDLVSKRYRLVGHPDMVIRLGDNPLQYKFYIYEYKTVDRADIKFDDIIIVFADHRLQVTFYYLMMRAMGWKVSSRLRVMYADRSNSKLFGGFPFKEITTPPEPTDHMRPFIDRLLLVNEGIETRRLPQRICPNIGCERARSCDLAVECFGRRDLYANTSEKSFPGVKAPPVAA